LGGAGTDSVATGIAGLRTRRDGSHINENYGAPVAKAMRRR